MNDYEKWYEICLRCEHAYIRKDDAYTIYCAVPEIYCPHKEEIEFADRKEE